MVKCEVLSDCNLIVAKGSVVEVSEKQYELARKFLKPLIKSKSEESEKVEETTAKVVEIEKRKKKK